MKQIFILAIKLIIAIFVGLFLGYMGEWLFKRR